MRVFSSNRSTLVVLILAILFSPHTLAQGNESLNDLRRENERLREQLSQLEAELAASKRQVERLQRQNQSLRESLTSVRERATQNRDSNTRSPQKTAPVATPAEKTAPVPEAPMASPESMFNAVKQSYLAELDEKPRGTDSEKRRFIGDAKRWARARNQEHRGPVRWIARVESTKPGDGRELIVQWRSVDPGSGLPFGEPFTLIASPRDAGRIQSSATHSVWELDGVATLRLEVDENLVAPSVFTARRLIGPYVEFAFNFDVRSMSPLGNVGKNKSR